eukprot:6780048-Alexandrium_andersonii.AAC.1
MSGRCTGWSWLAAGWPRHRLPGPAVVPCAGPVPMSKVRGPTGESGHAAGCHCSGSQGPPRM